MNKNAFWLSPMIMFVLSTGSAQANETENLRRLIAGGNPVFSKTDALKGSRVAVFVEKHPAAKPTQDDLATAEQARQAGGIVEFPSMNLLYTFTQSSGSNVECLLKYATHDKDILPYILSVFEIRGSIFILYRITTRVMVVKAKKGATIGAYSFIKGVSLENIVESNGYQITKGEISSYGDGVLVTLSHNNTSHPMIIAQERRKGKFIEVGDTKYTLAAPFSEDLMAWKPLRKTESFFSENPRIEKLLRDGLPTK